jgi:hemoglobin-like flavoprotein
MSIDVHAIRSSFELVKPIADQVVNLFYEILFTDYPAAKPLFAQVDMPKQKRALIGSLVTAVDNLDKPDPLIKFLLGLGERHAGYGAKEIHYDWVGASLLKSFRLCLGEHWNADLESQWAEVYGIMAEAMKAGARSAKSKVRPIQREPAQATPREPQSNGATNGTSANVGVSLPDSDQLPNSVKLSDAVKQHIQSSVDAIVQALIKAEVKRCFDERMQQISQMSPEELVKKAG